MKYETIKGSEKDFEGAPDWAMFLSKDKFGDLAWDEGDTNAPGLRYQWVYPENGIGVQKYAEGCIGICISGIIAERRPIAEPVWDGFSSVRVGEACEVRPYSDATEWQAGIVNYLSEHTIVIGLSNMTNGKAELVAHPATLKFRPIRSPEDVARDEEIVLLTDVICGKIPDVGKATAAMFAGRVYDAGYRKTPTVGALMWVTEKATREDCEAIVKLLSGK